MVRKAKIEKRSLGGGEGIATVYNIVSKEELCGAGRLYAKLVLPPGATVGWHRHTGETEPYYVLEGRGIFVDDDGSRTEVGPGDCCIIEEGQCHAMENASDTDDLVFMALIYNVK